MSCHLSFACHVCLGAVTGIATADVGIGKDGKPKDSFARGMSCDAMLSSYHLVM